MSKMKFNRRDFIKVITIGGTGLLVGCSLSTPRKFSASNENDENLGLFVQINSNDEIHIISPNSELGQGIHTGHEMIICE